MINRHGFSVGLAVLPWLFAGAAKALPTERSCLAAIPSQVISEQRLPGGSARVVAALLPPTGAAFRMQDLRMRLARLAAPGHLMHKSVSGWQVFSFWQHQALCVVQLRVSGRVVAAGFISHVRLGAGLSRHQDVGKSAGSVTAPHWWPALQDLHVDYWRDTHAAVRSILGYSRASEPATRALLVNRATRAGFVLAGSRTVEPGSSAAGSVLMFGQPGRELLVVLLPQGPRTGVVAHLKETFQ